MKRLIVLLLLTINVLANAQSTRTASNETTSRGNPRTSSSLPATNISAIVEGLKKFEGFFDFYYDEKTGRILLEIKKEQLDQEFLYFSSLSSGIGNGIERGQSSSAIAKFIKVGPKIMLVEPNYTYRAITENIDEKNAVDNAFAKSVIWGFVPVAAEEGKLLIDITAFLIRDSQKIGDRIGARGFQGPGAALTGGAGGRRGGGAGGPRRSPSR